MGRTVIDLPIEDVVAFLESNDRRHEWDIHVTVSEAVWKYVDVLSGFIFFDQDIKEMKRISETDFISKWSCVLWWQFWGGGGGGGEHGGGWLRWGGLLCAWKVYVKIYAMCVSFIVMSCMAQSLCNANLYAIEILMCPELDLHNSHK